MADVLDCYTAAESQLDQILADYLQIPPAARPTHDQLIAAHPEHAEALLQILQDLGWMQNLAGPPVGQTLPVTARDSGSPPSPSTPDDDLSTIDAGRYVGLQPHARGGLGEVYSALDRELHRKVALKRIQDRHDHDPRSQRQFLMEAEVTARLDHPGVVPVHSLFRDDHDRPCYTMRFIEGDTLDDALQNYHAGPPDPVAFRRLLQSFIQVCETVAYAHSRGILHRDLKPQNIMIGRFGETIVVDWGLAKVVGRKDNQDQDTTSSEDTLRLVGDSSLDRTAMGAAVGTPAYMSPEQAAGRWDVIDHASDVYNLGAVLYALLTGKPPIEGTNWPEFQQKIQRGDFPRPRSVNPTVPRALEAICLKAMAMNPQDRYPSARDLAQGVEQWLAGEPVAAYREPVPDRLLRWARKHRVLVTSAAVACTGLLALVWSVSIYRARTQVAENTSRYFLSESRSTSFAIIQILQRYARLDASAAATLDQIAAELSREPGWNEVDSLSLRQKLSDSMSAHWRRALELDESIDGKPGPRTRSYLRRLALSLARFGSHQKADKEIRNLLDSPDPGENLSLAAYDYARVYAICTLAARGDESLVARYASRAMDFLKQAESDGFFETSNLPLPLERDPDFASLRSRTDFLALCDRSREQEASPAESTSSH